MENFMDKLEKKFSAQDIIKANSQAEMAEAQRIKKEAEHYRKEIVELRKHAEDYSQQLEQLEELMEASRDYSEEFDRVLSKIDESDSKTHDVGVQIYRNVQAIVDKNREKIEEEIAEINKKMETVLDIVEYKNNAVGPLLIIIGLIALADLTFNVLTIFGII
ncbi:MAG: hypothetical protein VZR06_03810 [Butyrivibrio sp.]|jgi:DNA repair exonuclease SbcCD ATPase subunit|uniref:hypothetical protein n=1 Tax=Butyrivibrio sp. LB2008 TaxID=1408305 RepID=UPI00047E8CA4|nr:hypothetical protein [Butyrivibrio sp. LB2008]MEE3494260.1 hypothetical protein [Butyrivibrio sp.]